MHCHLRPPSLQSFSAKITRSNRRQTTSQVAPPAVSQASGDIQDGGAEVQDDVLLNASVLEWPDPDSSSSSSSAVIRRPAAERPKIANRVRASVFFGRGSAHVAAQTILTWCHQRLSIYGLYGAI